MTLDASPGAPVYVMGLGRAEALRLTAYSVGLLFLSAGVFSAVAGGSSGGSTSLGVGSSLLYVAVYFATTGAHELVHGAAFRLYGGRPRYGAGISSFMPYFYATSPGAFSIRQMIVISLAPLVIISTLALGVALLAPSLVGYMAVVFIGNTAGAVADIWMSSRLAAFLRVPDATAVDTGDSLAIYSQDPRAAEIVAGFSARDGRPAGFFQQWIIATFAVFILSFVVGGVGAFFTDFLLIGPRELPLVMFAKAGGGGGPEWTFSFAAPVVAGFAFAAIAWLFTRRAARPSGNKEV